MLIDTHAHLNFKAFIKDLDQVIDRAHQTGVEKIIIPAAKIDSSQKAIGIANKYPGCYAAVGIHPHHAADYILDYKLKSVLTDLIKDKKVVAVGEIGLDYHQYRGFPPISNEDKNKQQELFLRQCKIAVEADLPVIIHCREALDDLLLMLEQFRINNKITGVFHCFSGNRQNLSKVLEMGFYIGFDGNITYRENAHFQSIIRNVPPDRLLAETDSPYLTPVPHRGSRNEPCFLKYIISEIARIHRTKFEKIEDMTCENAIKLFKL